MNQVLAKFKTNNKLVCTERLIILGMRNKSIPSPEAKYIKKENM
jgi:hypothetical protein